MKNFGHIITKLRKEKGLTQADLGKQLNVSYQAVSKWENNLSQPDLDTISRMADIFEITIADFFALMEGKEIKKDKNNIDFEKIRKIKSELDTQIIQENKAQEIRRIDPLDNFKVPKKSNFSFKKFIWYLLSLLSAVVIILTCIAFLVKPTYNSKQIQNNLSSSIFFVSNDQQPSQNATGMFIDDDGTAIINFSLIEDSAIAKAILYNNKTYEIEKILGYDELRDVAIVKVNTNGVKIKPAKFANSDNIEENQKVYYLTSYNTTTCYQTKINNISKEYNINWFSVDIDENYFNKGGIIVDKYGYVVGILSLIDKEKVTPINELRFVEKNLNLTLSEFKANLKEFKFYDGDQLVSFEEVRIGETTTEYILNYDKEGYIFDGWYIDKTLTNKFDFSSPISTHFECYAKWNPISYTVEFDVNVEGINQTMEVQTFTYDISQKLKVCTFNIIGKSFDKWEYDNGNQTLYFADEETIINLTSIDNDRIILKATYKDIDYYIRYNDGFGNTLGNMQLTSYNENTILWDCKFDYPTGYHFVGWTDDFCNKTHNANNDSEFTQHSTSQFGIIDLYAKWEKNSFNLSISDGTSTQYLATIEYNQTFTLPSCPFTAPEEGKYFSHWEYQSLSINDRETISNLGDIENSTDYEIVLIAKWRPAQYTLRFNANGGQGTMEDQIVTYGEFSITLNKNEFTFDGYIFCYWKCSKNNLNYKDQGELYSHFTSVDGEIITLFATWAEPLSGEGSEDNPYTISSTQDLKNFTTLRTYVQSYSYGHVVLTNDIDCSNFYYTSLASFYGIFDGKGHTIYNPSNSIFYDNSGTIRNLNVNISNNDAYLSTIGIICEFLDNGGVIENCNVYGSITLTSSERISFGGIVGAIRIYSISSSNPAIIRNCQTNLTINISPNSTTPNSNISIGGIVGTVDTLSSTKEEYSYLIENCISNSTINSSEISTTNLYIGGFIGSRDIGYIGSPFWGKYSNCFAQTNLNLNITAENYNINTFAEIFEHDLISNCYVSEESNLTINNISPTENVDRISSAQFTSKNWWIDTMAFNENIWLIEEGKLPVLKPKEEE